MVPDPSLLIYIAAFCKLLWYIPCIGRNVLGCWHAWMWWKAVQRIIRELISLLYWKFASQTGTFRGYKCPSTCLKHPPISMFMFSLWQMSPIPYNWLPVTVSVVSIGLASSLLLWHVSGLQMPWQLSQASTQFYVYVLVVANGTHTLQLITRYGVSSFHRPCNCYYCYGILILLSWSSQSRLKSSYIHFFTRFKHISISLYHWTSFPIFCHSFSVAWAARYMVPRGSITWNTVAVESDYEQPYDCKSSFADEMLSGPRFKKTKYRNISQNLEIVHHNVWDLSKCSLLHHMETPAKLEAIWWYENYGPRYRGFKASWDIGALIGFWNGAQISFLISENRRLPLCQLCRDYSRFSGIKDHIYSCSDEMIIFISDISTRKPGALVSMQPGTVV